MAQIPDTVRDSVRNFIGALKKEKRIHHVYVYGSHAAGAPGKWSDVDIAVVSPDFSEDLFEERIMLMKIAIGIDDRIEPHPFRPEDFNAKHPLVTEITEKGIEFRE